MAVLNFNITIPDAQVSRVVTALKAYFNTPSATNAELTEAMRQEFIARLKNIVSATERQAAISAAEAANYDVGAT